MDGSLKKFKPHVPVFVNNKKCELLVSESIFNLLCECPSFQFHGNNYLKHFVKNSSRLMILKGNISCHRELLVGLLFKVDQSTP